MDKPLSREELEEELCDYCPLEDSVKGVHCYGGAPVMCVDSGCCEKAYEIYLEEFEEENEEMDNLEKAFKANELAIKIENHNDNIKDLKTRADLYKKEKENQKDNRFEVLLRGFNSDIHIEADEDLIEFMILAEHCRLEKAEKELDNLINGDVNRIKAMLNNDGEA